MAWLKWLPWRYLLRQLAQSHGFLDPMTLLAGLQRFSQPSEVEQPVELLRAGALFHARGLINSRVVQHNLDWVWPYWIERQFDPSDIAFIPRAFSVTHVNLTHRNWTAVGYPEYANLPIVDPRGLVTPHFDSWSVDGWIIQKNGRSLFPSKSKHTSQRLDLAHDPAVITDTSMDDLKLSSKVSVQLAKNLPVCRVEFEARSNQDAWLVVALRPYNPEGVSFIHRIELDQDSTEWLVDDKYRVRFSEPAAHHHTSEYRNGDVSIHLFDREKQAQVECDVGMATAAALFKVEGLQLKRMTVDIPLETADKTQSLTLNWTNSLQPACKLSIPDKHFQFLYDAGLHTLLMHSVEDIYPGPYTYKRFWFRDAAFILHALLCAGFTERVERALDRFPSRQTTTGYFRSQDGEWDSNGEALFIINRFCEMTNQPLKKDWWLAIYHGASWIIDKRLKDGSDSRHAGLLPAGFSAEHLGPNDFYYWDDFWGIAGLRSAAALAKRAGNTSSYSAFEAEADDFQQALERNLERTAKRIGAQAIPASPYRRLDAGAIGSLAGGYPLQLMPPDDPRLLATAEFLMNDCFFNEGFFQDMIHSGINAYLTLHVAQVLLRAGDSRFRHLMCSVADMASPTGQWPEAIHPHTKGGCMGDGQHVWAVAEWVLMIRNCFVREEADALIIGAGIFPEWLTQEAPLSFGPAPTAFGTISLTIAMEPGGPDEAAVVNWQSKWHSEMPAMEIRLPGFPTYYVKTGETCSRLTRAPQ